MKVYAEVLSNIYAAFGRGDVPSILERLDENVEWEYGASPCDVPWLLARRGRAQVGQFFETLNTHTQFENFAVKTILTGENIAVALVDLTFQVKRTGKRVEEVDEAHIWHFGAGGQVVRFRHRADTLQHQLAWQG